MGLCTGPSRQLRSQVPFPVVGLSGVLGCLAGLAVLPLPQGHIRRGSASVAGLCLQFSLSVGGCGSHLLGGPFSDTKGTADRDINCLLT